MTPAALLSAIGADAHLVAAVPRRGPKPRASPAIAVVTATVDGPARRIDLAMRMLADLLLRAARVDFSSPARLSDAHPPASPTQRRP